MRSDFGSSASLAAQRTPTVCLVMIVRNEAKVIRRCLNSVKHLISFWSLCDTGSTDTTQAVILEALADVPGELHHDPWVNFGHNRTLSMDRARGKADYHLLLDADMVLNQKGDFPDLAADQYLIRFEGPCDYAVPRLVSDRHVWTYHGVTHEYIDSPTASSAVPLTQLSITHHEDGGGRPQRYQRDTELLQEGLRSDPTNSRYYYYLAQCYRDSERPAEALEWYEKRARLGGWNQEVWSALYQMGRMQEILACDWRVVLNSYLQAYNFRPTRLEPIYRIVRFYREHQQFALGYQFSRLVTETGYPEDILFVERAVYDHLLPVEHAACCFETGRVAEGHRVCRELLDRGELPVDQIAAVEALVERNERNGSHGGSESETSQAIQSLAQSAHAADRSRKGPLAFVDPGWWEVE